MDAEALMIIPILGEIIGLVTVVGVIVLVIMWIWFRERTRRLRDKMNHEERVAAIEKGLPVPPPPPDPIRQRNYIMRGLVLIALGLGFAFWSLTSPGDMPWGIGAILFFIGLAILIAHSLTERRKKESYLPENEHRPVSDSPS